MSITVRLYGGMGNQMFQYAKGRAVSISKGTDLKLDTAYYCKANAAHMSWKPYALDQWSGVTAEQVQQSVGEVLDGYWQDEKCFLSAERTIREEFVPKYISPQVKELAKDMGSNSVCVSFRRGDYNNIGVCLPLDYYVKALQKIVSVEPSPHLFIFSDDGEWVKDNFRTPYQTTTARVYNVAGQLGTGCEAEDLWLMSQCKHTILANSTFSWWGAWLNPSTDRAVIAPQPFYTEVPNRWIKIQA